jgi:hypothetical protein
MFESALAHPRILTVTAVTVMATLAMSATACGGDDAGSAATTAASSDTAAADDTPVEIVAVDYAFEGLPDDVAAGTTLTLRNDATDEVHEVIAYRLPDGEQRRALDLLALPEAEIGALLAGPPSLGLLALPGEQGEAVAGDGTLAEPGRYLVFCAIPTGASADDVQAAIAETQQTGGPPPQIAGGPPHFTQGMFGELTVR